MVALQGFNGADYGTPSPATGTKENPSVVQKRDFYRAQRAVKGAVYFIQNNEQMPDNQSYIQKLLGGKQAPPAKNLPEALAVVQEHALPIFKEYQANLEKVTNRRDAKEKDQREFMERISMESQEERMAWRQYLRDSVPEEKRLSEAGKIEQALRKRFDPTNRAGDMFSTADLTANDVTDDALDKVIAREKALFDENKEGERTASDKDVHLLEKIASGYGDYADIPESVRKMMIMSMGGGETKGFTLDADMAEDMAETLMDETGLGEGWLGSNDEVFQMALTTAFQTFSKQGYTGQELHDRALVSAAGQDWEEVKDLAEEMSKPDEPVSIADILKTALSKKK